MEMNSNDLFSPQTLPMNLTVRRVTPCAPFGVPPSGGPDRVNTGLQTADGAPGMMRQSGAELTCKSDAKGTCLRCVFAGWQEARHRQRGEAATTGPRTSARFAAGRTRITFG